MKLKPIYFFGIVALAIIVATFLSIISLTPESPVFNSNDILSFRKAKNQFLVQKVDAPFYNNANFDSLIYYTPNEMEIYKSDVFLVKDGAELDLMPDRPGYPSHKIHAYLILEKETWRDTLFVLKDLTEQSDSLYFIPFADKGNGRESYGGGRYLDLTIKPGRQVIIDFNFAYNPYCAYQADFVCPKIPGCNQLSKEIKAGEKNYPF
jgi:hypothetical protein